MAKTEASSVSEQMKELVEISKGLEVEFSRDPKGEKRPEEPTGRREKETRTYTFAKSRLV